MSGSCLPSSGAVHVSTVRGVLVGVSMAVEAVEVSLVVGIPVVLTLDTSLSQPVLNLVEILPSIMAYLSCT